MLAVTYSLMKTEIIFKTSPRHHWRSRPGFALVVTLSLMILLTIIAVGLLSLSAVSLRSSSQSLAQAEARANARLALMLAIGELQKEMGPDMRVSAEAAIFDQNAQTEAIEGVAQSRWFASYNSWGGWLNDSYSLPDGGGALRIGDTYTPKRDKMFRRWLLSLPEGMAANVNAPVNASGWDDSNSVVLVGERSLGTAAPMDQITRAYLNRIGDTGRGAWWIGPENHKARIDKAKRPRNLAAHEWETSHGDSTEVGVGALQGLETLDGNQAHGDKLVTTQTLRPAGVAEGKQQQHFFDLTASSRGVLASVRTGHLKKDLSLLFEKGKETLPSPYRYDPTVYKEPSIRPMSPDIAAKPVLPERQFASWTRMRHFYRMYRQDSDAQARSFENGGTKNSPGITWTGSKPSTDSVVNSYSWSGEDTYVRFPILTSITYVLSLKTRSVGATSAQLQYVATPVLVYWNPYNVDLNLPDRALSMRSYLSFIQPLVGRLFVNGIPKTDDLVLDFDDDFAPLGPGDGKPIVFKPGEFRIFSPKSSSLVENNVMPLEPGFDPQAYGGLYIEDQFPAYGKDTNVAFDIRFGYKAKHAAGGRYGNTPFSFNTFRMWTPTGWPNPRTTLAFNHHVDWLNTSQVHAPLTPTGNPARWIFDDDLLPVAYFQMNIKSMYDHHYDTIPGWEKDWRCRNWIQAPPYNLGIGLYLSENVTIANTQRIDCPVEMRFGSLVGSGKDLEDIIQHDGNSALLGVNEAVSAIPFLELPTAPIGSLAGFSGMRINPGWCGAISPELWNGLAPAKSDTSENSLYFVASKEMAYQSGVTGPGIGNSFLHPMIPRTDVYQYFDNSQSMEMKNRLDTAAGYTKTDTKAYCDYWDHVLLLNDALWDDYFVSSLADQTRPGASASSSLATNLQKLADGEKLANSRYLPYLDGRAASDLKAELEAADGYLKAASHLMVDGMFNVNSTSVAAWQALFSGIRERQVVYRDQNGALRPVAIPSGKRIAISRFNTATTDKETTNPKTGITREDGQKAWSDVRFLNDAQLRKLAEECVKQVKRRGPFLNFSEFINRRLSNNDLGVMGALQSAIDYDDASPASGSINFAFKQSPEFMIKESHLGTHAFKTPAAAVGSRFAGIPGYVIQSDLLKPIANTLSVRDDTFRIRAYGDSVNKNGVVIARAWCEAIVQRVPEYVDESNKPEVPSREMRTNGEFSSIEDSALTSSNRRFGRKFKIESFRWLSNSEI
jgi:hypothetical protein